MILPPARQGKIPRQNAFYETLKNKFWFNGIFLVGNGTAAEKKCRRIFRVPDAVLSDARSGFSP